MTYATPAIELEALKPGLDLLPRRIPIGDVLFDALVEMTEDGEWGANDAVEDLLDRFCLAVNDSDDLPAVWAEVVARDEGAADVARRYRIGDDFTISYSTSEVAAHLFGLGDIEGNDELVRRLAWTVAHDPAILAGTPRYDAIEQEWLDYAALDAAEKQDHPLHETAVRFDVPRAVPYDVDALVGQLADIAVDRFPGIRTLEFHWMPEVVDVQVTATDSYPDGPVDDTAAAALNDLSDQVGLAIAGDPAERTLAVVFDDADWPFTVELPGVGDVQPASDGGGEGPKAPAAGPGRVVVDIPAVWVGLVAFGEFDHAPAEASHDAPYEDLLGRPVNDAGFGAAGDDAFAYYDDHRRVSGGSDDGEVAVVASLMSGQGNYWFAMAVETVDGYGEDEDEYDLAGNQTVHGDVDVTVDVRLLWPSPNVREVAIGTVKRLYAVTKRVAARVVDEARWDLLPREVGRPDVRQVVGSVAVGHQHAGTVAALINAGVAGEAEADVDADRVAVVTDRGRLVASHLDWSTVWPEDGPATLPTGLPTDGGPNPVSLAKKLVKLARG